MLDWMERYESEVDERDTELMILREKRENQVEKMEAVKKLVSKITTLSVNALCVNLFLLL